MKNHRCTLRCPAAAAGALLVLLSGMALAPTAQANERRFVYTHETETLPVGEIELEPWITVRGGRDGYYRRMDHRVELEWGVMKNVHTALYLNWSATSTVDGDSFSWQGISNEWKWQLADPSADPIGFALYFEPAIGPEEAELELELLFDKRIGDLVVALDIAGEVEWEWETETGTDGTPARETEMEYVLEVSAGASYLFTESVSSGIEVRNHTEFGDEGVEHSAMFAGPVASWRGKGIWATGTVLFQLPALASQGNRTLELQSHEAVEGRIIVGVHL